MDIRLLHVPGGGDSGPDHWHTHWERTDPRCERVIQSDWFDGSRSDWVAALDRQVRASAVPTVVVAHSLGNLAVAHWAAAAGASVGPVVAGMMVAPVDVESQGLDPDSIYARFRPLPMATLPFPSTLVASRDDPWISIERAAEVASAWGSTFVDAGPMQHLGSECRLGTWPQGRAIVAQLIERAGPAR
ncbi:MAG: RBBP9/YdeN family alpha/beta hydrolase [Acidimicrobiales bacterium]